MTHLGYKATLTFSGCVWYERPEHTHTHPYRDSKTQDYANV